MITKNSTCQDEEINQTPVAAVSNSREINGFQLPNQDRLHPLAKVILSIHLSQRNSQTITALYR